MSYGIKAAERISGKTVFITGASSGIGMATALELAAAANGRIRLILAARREERLLDLKSKLEQTHPGIDVLAFKMDVSKYQDIAKRVDSLPKEWSDIDVLVNNAGLVFGREKVGELALPDVETMFFTNVLGLFALTNHLVPRFRQKGSGDIVMLGSIAGRDAYPEGSIYCATKASLRSFSHSLRKETINTGIRVIEVDPGAVETEFSIVRFRGDKEQADATYKGTTPLVAEDIAEIITFALTRRANTVIAETLVFPNHQASARDVHRS